MHAPTGRNARRTLLWIVVGLLVVAALYSGCWGMGGPEFRFGFSNLFGLWGLITIGLTIWVWVDANRKGMPGVLWGLLVFFTSVVGLVVYLIVSTSMAQPAAGGAHEPGWGPPRPPGPGGTSGPSTGGPATPPGTCRQCGRGVRDDFKLCPYCGVSLAEHCGSCGRKLEADWATCPYCGSGKG